MIAAVMGRVHNASPGMVEIETGNGMTFRIAVPVSSFPRLRPGQDVLLHTVLKIRDEDPILYGFLDCRERAIFEKLLQVTGVGGKIAMACISGFTADELAAAIEGKDVERISSVPGIGKKTAQRLILELTGKLEFAAPRDDEAQRLHDELVSALINLGYSAKIAREAIGRLLKEQTETRSFETLFRLALRRIQR